MIVAATGHRPNKLRNEYNGIGPVSDWLRTQFTQTLKDHQATQIISGMALGVDMLFAEVGIEMNLPVIAAVPFEGQEGLWPEESIERYRKILSRTLVTRRVVSPGGYTRDKMQIRNQWMVDNSDLLIAVWDGTSGGTKNCRDYAVKKQTQIIRIDPRNRRN